MKRSKAFTLVELLTVITIIALLVAILVPSLRQAVWSARKSACQGNVKGAVTALVEYAGEYTGVLPSRGFGPGTVRFDVIGRDVTLEKDSADSNSRNLFLAVRLKSITPEILICPETNDAPAGLSTYDAATGKDEPNHDFDVFYNGNYRNKFSYSYHLQFRDRDALARGYPLAMVSDTRMAVLADRSPFLTYPGANYMAVDPIEIPAGTTASQANSANHGHRGQNVGFLDGHVEWFNRPTAGPNEDNIYTVWTVTGEKENGTIAFDSMPLSDLDSFLAP